MYFTFTFWVHVSVGTYNAVCGFRVVYSHARSCQDMGKRDFSKIAPEKFFWD